MATALLKKLDDLTECSICYCVYEDPRQLTCLHSFCLKCLQDYARINVKWCVMSCPLCRKETKLPCDGIQGFPRNFFIEKIMEIKRLSGPVNENTKCDVCSEDDETAASSTGIPIAEMRCTNCHCNLCTRCTKEHRRHLKNHCIVELGCDKAKEQLAKTFATSYCSSHPQDTVRMFCLDCNVVICFICFAEKHQMHKCSDINKEAEMMRQKMETDIQEVSSCLTACQQSMTKMDEKRNNFLKQIETVEKDICTRSNHQKDIIDRDTNALLIELESIKSSQLMDMCMKIEELDRCVTMLNSFKTHGEEIVAHGSDSDVCHSVNQFHNRYGEIAGNFRDLPFQEFSPKEVTLKITAVNEVEQKNVVGRIEAPLLENFDMPGQRPSASEELREDNSPTRQDSIQASEDIYDDTAITYYSDDSDEGGGAWVNARAFNDYKAEEDDQISFVEGDIITNIEETDDWCWWVGDAPDGTRGKFPSKNYVEYVDW